MKIRNPFGLSSIVSSFTKTLEKLEQFQEKNAKKIKNMRNDLQVKELEQERAVAIANNIKDFIDERDDTESVSD